MSWEQKPNGCTPVAQDLEAVLRHSDGSLDIAAYAKLAHRERAMAIASSAREGIRRVREMVSGVRATLAPAARPGPACGKHHAPVSR